VFEAYAAMGNAKRPWKKSDEPVLLDEPVLAEIAKKYNKSVGQVRSRTYCQ
jgi:alcohol dehydrogenase (NADP+)